MGTPVASTARRCNFDDVVQLYAARQSALAGALNHRAVGRRIAERHAEFDGGGSAACHGDQQFVGGLQSRDRPP